MSDKKRSILEHVAIYVQDISWYINFFEQTLGMSLKQVDGVADNPDQVWIIGGLQFIEDRSFNKNQGQLAHLALVTENLSEVLKDVYRYENVTKVAGKEENWIQLPDGLILELFEEKTGAIQEALAIDLK